MTEPYYGSYTYPRWMIALAWVVNICIALPIPIVAVYKICKNPGSSLLEVNHVIVKFAKKKC